MNKKKFSYLLAFCILSFAFCLNVRAIAFEYNSSDEICYVRANFTYLASSYHSSFTYNNKTYSDCSNFSKDHRKWVSDKKNPRSKVAYCATRKNKFVNNLDVKFSKYDEDDEWRNKSNCKYRVDGTGELKNDGDCSIIAGFVIKEGFKNGDTAKKHWFYAQTSLWFYLKNYASYPYYFNNGKDSDSKSNQGTYATENLYKTGDYTKTFNIIKEAWKNYSNFKRAIGNVESTKSSDIHFTVNGDFKLSYFPNGDCEIGKYKTGDITIKNDENNDIYITILNKWRGVDICYYGSSGRLNCTDEDLEDIKIGGGNSLVLFLTTTRNNIGTLNFKVSAKYVEQVNTSADYYNTRLYKPVCIKNNKEVTCSDDGTVAQNMLINEKQSSGGKLNIDHKKSITNEITQIPIIHESCPSISDNVSSNVYGEHKESDPVKKMCKSGLTDSTSSDSKNYSVQFSGCTCHSITDPNSNTSVSVIVLESVRFQYGSLDLENTYPGGGFGLATSGSSNKTTYVGNVEWYFADHDSNNNPYYRDGSTGVVASTTSAKNSLQNTVVNSLKNDINKSDDKLLSLKIDTKDSNDYSKGSVNANLDIVLDDEIKYTKYSSSDNKGKKIGVFKGTDSVVEMKEAFFNKDGNVKYDKDNDYSISGGNNYYTPLNFDIRNRFPYNIKSSNLSMSNYFKFYFEAPCDIVVNEYEYDVTYRTIDLTNPFPKKIPTNWGKWMESSTNSRRLKNTFANYPSGKLVYEADLSGSAFSKISLNEKAYTNWENINENGTNSSFINGNNGFVIINNKDSFCKIGEFDSSCDK